MSPRDGLRLVAGRGPISVDIPEKGMHLSVHGPMGLWLLKEVCIDGEYEAVTDLLLPGDTLIDVGAGVGEFCVDMARRFPGIRIHAFEPLAASRSLLEKNLADNGISNVEPRPEALGPKTGTAHLFVNPRAPHLASTIKAGKGRDDACDVPMISLDDAVSRVPGGNVVIKMDCEGAEFDILRSVSRSTGSRIAAMVMEFHEPGTGWSRKDLVRLVEGLGFDVSIRPNPAYGHLGILHAYRT